MGSRNIRNYPQPVRAESATDALSPIPIGSQTGCRDPVQGVRRNEVKGRKKGQPIQLTTNEWYKAQQLGDSYWLYAVGNPLSNPDPLPVMIKNPAKQLEHAAKPLVSARFYDIPAHAISNVVKGNQKVSNAWP